jgi:hypothetical protein
MFRLQSAFLDTRRGAEREWRCTRYREILNNENTFDYAQGFCASQRGRCGSRRSDQLHNPRAHSASRSISGDRFRAQDSLHLHRNGDSRLRSAALGAKVPNAECVGTADLYDMHQKAGIEAWGAEVPTTRDYRSLLDRKDVDAVIVAVADFQHRRVVLDCVAAGKDVYCEKPMSHNVADGLAMVEAVQAASASSRPAASASAISSTRRRRRFMRRAGWARCT